MDTQPSEALLLTGDVVHGHVVLWLIFANIFVSTLLVVVVSLCFSQRKTYKRELRAAYVNSYGIYSRFIFACTFEVLSLIIRLFTIRSDNSKCNTTCTEHK